MVGEFGEVATQRQAVNLGQEIPKKYCERPWIRVHERSATEFALEYEIARISEREVWVGQGSHFKYSVPDAGPMGRARRSKAAGP